MKAKAYGKILLFGAYGILEPGNIGLVLNVNKGTTTETKETESGKIIFDMKNFKINAEVKLDLLHLFKNPGMIYVKNAVQYSFEYLRSKDIKVKDIKITTVNDAEFQIGRHKTGFGSSATSTVSAVAAILKLHDIDDRETVYKISRYSHYKSQGDLGSGFDVFSACFGSHFFTSQEERIEGFLDYMKNSRLPQSESYIWPSQFSYILAFSGKSASTEKLIKKVNAFKKQKPSVYNELMKKYSIANNHAALAFKGEDMKEIISSLDLSFELRRKLGELSGADIESPKLSSLLKETRNNGAYISGLVGAGGGDTIFSICENKEKLTEFLDEKGYAVIDDIEISSQGYEFQ